MIGRSTRRTGSGREPHQEGREWSGGTHEWSEGPPDSREGQQAHLESQEWSGVHPGKPGVVGTPSRTVRRPTSIARSGLEANPKGRE